MKLATSIPSALDSGLAGPAVRSVEGRRQRDLWELLTGYTLILLVIWTQPPWQKYFYVAALFFYAVVLPLSFTNRNQWGLRIANLARSSWVIVASLLVAAASVWLAARMHTLRLPGGLGPLPHRYAGYIVWSFLQQVLLQNFFLLRLLRLIGRPRTAVLAAAALFSLAHLPNPVLTLATFVLGLAACLLFVHYRNLYPLAVAHAILGVTLAITVPSPLIRNMRVGLGYLTYPKHHTTTAATPTTPYPRRRA